MSKKFYSVVNEWLYPLSVCHWNVNVMQYDEYDDAMLVKLIFDLFYQLDINHNNDD